MSSRQIGDKQVENIRIYIVNPDNTEEHIVAPNEDDFNYDNNKPKFKTMAEQQGGDYTLPIFIEEFNDQERNFNSDIHWIYAEEVIEPDDNITQDEIRKIFANNDFSLGGFIDKLLIAAMEADSINFKTLSPALTTILKVAGLISEVRNVE